MWKPAEMETRRLRIAGGIRHRGHAYLFIILSYIFRLGHFFFTFFLIGTRAMSLVWRLVWFITVPVNASIV
jgi:hypothetical protein